MPGKHLFSEEIIKSCDIRGVVGENLVGTDAYHIGRSFGTILRERGKTNCAVGRDGRLSSAALFSKTAEGLTDSGIQVLDLGLVPTPLVYFSIGQGSANAGIMITASHNPAEYNGFKFLTDEGPFHEKDILQLSATSRSGVYTSGNAEILQLKLIPSYLKYISSFLVSQGNEKLKTLSIVWDPGNGATAAILDDFLKTIPGNHAVICGEVDGNFPVHHPDPSLPENMEHLIGTVLEKEADLGIAFDGDGDRIGVVDSEGVQLSGDEIMVLFARDFLKTNPGATVMSEVKASQFFYDEVAALGGIPLMWRVGHTHQKEKMQNEGIGLAGETSGHFFFGENKTYDDGLFSAVKLLNILAGEKNNLTQIRKSFPSYHDSGEIRIRMIARERQRILSELKTLMTLNKRDYISIDGIRTRHLDGFWMIRGSNTQPHLTIRCEAASRKGMIDCMKDLQENLRICGYRGNELA